MTLKWIIKENGINKSDLTIDTSIAFSAMSSAIISGTGDFVSLFEPNALQLEKENKGYSEYYYFLIKLNLGKKEMSLNIHFIISVVWKFRTVHFFKFK